MARRDRPVSQRQAWWLTAAALSAWLPLTAQLPSWLVLAATAMMLLRSWITWRQWHLPPRWLMVILVIAGTLAVGLHYRTVFGRVPGVALLAIFLSLKLLELRAARDAIAVVLLCYFLVMAQFLFTQTMTTAAIALLTLLFTTAALAAANDDRPPPAQQLARAASMLAQALPFMLLLFLLFPRVEGPLWGLPQDRFSAVSGLSDSMSPGSIAQLSQSDAIAFRVKFKESAPAQSQLYWRGPVMPLFDGRTWRVSRNAGNFAEPPYSVSGAAVSYEVTLEPHGKHWLFALEHPAQLPAESAFTEDLQLLSRPVVRNRLRYELRSHPDMPLLLAEPPALLRESLRLPREGNPRIREIAAQWRAAHGEDNAAIVAAAERFFATQILSYTLNPPLLGANVVDEFLFETKRGFCEHFSSAFVFALRAAGVPARVVAGYQGGEINPVDGYLVVRQYDAHAWSEAWIDGRGWVRIDPTAISAPRRIADNLAAAVPASEPLPLLARADLSWLRDWRHRLEAISNGWNQWVIGYTPQRQRELLQNLGMESPDWRRMTAWMTALCGGALLLLAAWILHQRRHEDPARRLWRTFTQRLARRGVTWRDWEGPLAFARRAAEALPHQATAITEIAQIYARLRYAPEGDSRPALRELRQLIHGFRP